jgi:hypothetical protein
MALLAGYNGDAAPARVGTPTKAAIETRVGARVSMAAPRNDLIGFAGHQASAIPGTRDTFFGSTDIHG